MKLKHITFTGVDGKTDLSRLLKIQQNYPLAEFGILVAKNWRENGNRYFNPSYLAALDWHGGPGGLKLSAHLCGSIARAAIHGNFEPFREWAKAPVPFFFDRCQINISTSTEKPNSFSGSDDSYLFDEIILQQKSVKDCSLFMNSKECKGISVLLDASGGQGIDTPIEILSGDYKVGYAGGINPDNVEEKLSFLLNHPDVGDFWIDMESGVRTDDWFDTNKVVDVLEKCYRIINNIK